MDGGGFMQERDLSYAQISSLKSIHGCMLFNRLTESFFYTEGKRIRHGR